MINLRCESELKWTYVKNYTQNILKKKETDEREMEMENENKEKAKKQKVVTKTLGKNYWLSNQPWTQINSKNIAR